MILRHEFRHADSAGFVVRHRACLFISLRHFTPMPGRQPRFAADSARGGKPTLPPLKERTLYYEAGLIFGRQRRCDARA